jgi:hypothetical protein
VQRPGRWRRWPERGNRRAARWLTPPAFSIFPNRAGRNPGQPHVIRCYSRPTRGTLSADWPRDCLPVSGPLSVSLVHALQRRPTYGHPSALMPRSLRSVDLFAGERNTNQITMRSTRLASRYPRGDKSCPVLGSPHHAPKSDNASSSVVRPHTPRLASACRAATALCLPIQSLCAVSASIDRRSLSNRLSS